MTATNPSVDLLFQGTDTQSINLLNRRAHQIAGARRALAAIDAACKAQKTELSFADVFRDIDKQVRDRRVPFLVTRFLDTQWRIYLIRLYCRESGKGRRWNEAAKTPSQLTWVLQPKTDEESRRRLFELLPQLFGQLHDGLEFLCVEPADQDVFFAELSQLVQAALHPRAATEARKPRSLAAEGSSD